MRYLRKVESVTRMDRIPNEDIRRRLGVEAVLDVADRKKKNGERRLRQCCRKGWREGYLRKWCVGDDHEDDHERSG